MWTTQIFFKGGKSPKVRFPDSLNLFGGTKQLTERLDSCARALAAERLAHPGWATQPAAEKSLNQKFNQPVALCLLMQVAPSAGVPGVANTNAGCVFLIYSKTKLLWDYDMQNSQLL